MSQTGSIVNVCLRANRQAGSTTALRSQPMKMLEELLTFCCSPMQSIIPAVARQNTPHEEIKGRDGEIERDEEGGIEEERESACVRS